MGWFTKEQEKKVVETVSEADIVVGKYDVECCICKKKPCDKKWGGMFFHKKCFRLTKRYAARAI